LNSIRVTWWAPGAAATDEEPKICQLRRRGGSSLRLGAGPDVAMMLFMAIAVLGCKSLFLVLGSVGLFGLTKYENLPILKGVTFCARNTNCSLEIPAQPVARAKNTIGEKMLAAVAIC
jgi:hypothetical protein